MSEYISEQLDDNLEIIISEKADEFDGEITDDVIKELDKIEQEQAEKVVPDVIKEIEDTPSTDGKKKRKKKIIDPLITFCKMYFSSLMARSCKYALLNMDDVQNKLICLNSRNKITFEDFLLQYSPGDLAVQILLIKDLDLFRVFKERFQLPDKGLVLLNLNNIRRAISVYQKYKNPETCPLIIYTDNEKFYLKYTDITKEANGVFPIVIEKFGIIYNDWRTIQILKKIVYKLEHLEEVNCIVEDSLKYNDLLPYIYQNLLFYPIQTTRFKDKDSNLIYPEFNDLHKSILVFVDGRDIVSMREYIKKKDDDTYTLSILACISLPNTDIYYLSIFEDNCVKAICSRPFTGTYPFVLTKKEMA